MGHQFYLSEVLEALTDTTYYATKFSTIVIHLDFSILLNCGIVTEKQVYKKASRSLNHRNSNIVQRTFVWVPVTATYLHNDITMANNSHMTIVGFFFKMLSGSSWTTTILFYFSPNPKRKANKDIHNKQHMKRTY